MSLRAFGGRRFLLTLGCGAACTVLVWFGKIGDAVFASIIIGTVGAYIAGNTAQKFSPYSQVGSQVYGPAPGALGAYASDDPPPRPPGV